jgi:hypothetical protein
VNPDSYRKLLAFMACWTDDVECETIFGDFLANVVPSVAHAFWVVGLRLRVEEWVLFRDWGTLYRNGPIGG